MENQEKSPMGRPNYFVVTIVVVILITAGGWFVLVKMKDIRNNIFFQSHTEITQSSHQVGNYDESVDKYENLLKVAPSPTAATKTKAFLAYDLFQRNQGDDRKNAINLYKEIASDQSLPVSTKVLYLNDLAGLIPGMDSDFIYANFSDFPIKIELSKLSGAYGSTKVAIDFLENLDKLYENSYTKLSLATNYNVLLANNELSGTIKEEMASKVLEYVKNAEPLLEKDTYRNSTVALQYLIRARAIAYANKVLASKESTPKEMEDNYLLAIRKAEENASNDVNARSVFMQAHYYHALFFFLYPGNDRDVNIRKTLGVFAEAIKNPVSYKLTRAFFHMINNLPDTDSAKKNSIRLANISPEFKEFLKSVGWSI